MSPEALAEAYRHLGIVRRDLALALKAQPRDRHFRSLSECPRVIMLADCVERWEAAIAMVERRKRGWQHERRVLDRRDEPDSGTGRYKRAFEDDWGHHVLIHRPVTGQTFHGPITTLERADG